MKVTIDINGRNSRRGWYLEPSQAYQDVIYKLYGHDIFYELQGNTKDKLLLVYNQEEKKIHLVNVRLYSRSFSTGRRDREGKEIRDTEYEIRDYSEVEEIKVGKKIEVDYFMFKASIYLSERDKLDVVTSKRGTNAKRLVEEFKSTGVEVIELERKWYNKIVGFRSKSILKGTVAIIIYLAIALGVVYLIYSNYII